MARYTKNNVIDNVSKEMEMSRKQVEKIYNGLVKNITDAISGGHTVALPDLGIFGSKERKARSGRNPKTGDALKIAAKKVGTFKFGKKVRDLISGGKKSKK